MSKSSPEDKLTRNKSLDNDPLQRLASFKAPRDLSLGGMKPNKKVFIPNLNAVRNKVKGNSTINTQHQKKDDKSRRDRKNDRNRNRTNGSNIIKSTGVFSEGLGNVEKHFSRVSYGRDVDSSSTLRKPTIKVREIAKIDKDLDDQKIRTAIGDIDCDDDVGEDFKRALDLDAPVKLPLDDGCSNKSKTFTVKLEIVKEEPGEDDFSLSTEQKILPGVKQEFLEETDVVKLLKADEPKLFVIQLPDAMPGRGGSAEAGSARQSPAAGPAESDEPPTEDRCHLTDLSEGRIGKLLIRQSGRVTLLLGDTEFEVSPGSKPTYAEEVVSMAADDASRSANLVSLGFLQHKLLITPAWETLFAKMPVGTT